MGAYESWIYTLRCPQCARTGAAKEVELDGWSYMRACQADSVLLGYAIQRLHLTEPSDDIKKVVCQDCGVWAGDAVDQARWG